MTPKPLYLRMGGHVFPLRDGEMALGRSSQCEVVLVDGRASRRHALIRIVEGHATIEDLQSRNGILVDGVRVSEPTALLLGSRITIGSTHLIVVDTAGTAADTAQDVARMRRRTRDSAAATEPGDIFGGLLDQCANDLDEGRVSDAEFSITNLLMSMQAGVEGGANIEPKLFELATELASLLAEQTGHHDWLDRALELHRAAGRVLGPSALRRIESGDVRPDPSVLAQYVKEVSARPLPLDARERLERLGRLSQGH
ncbi:MAG: FHA domain-containing protein [Deltaproteobacteria bacterium]|nr:FHA domain-containing protein [Deltaproteobacteria bacterium]